MVDYYWIYVERTIDGEKVHQVYQGESLETETNKAAVGYSHHHASLSVVNGLKFGKAFEDGYPIGGYINLKSHLGRILRRAKSGDLGRIEEIHIKRVEEATE